MCALSSYVEELHFVTRLTYLTSTLIFFDDSCALMEKKKGYTS